MKNKLSYKSMSYSTAQMARLALRLLFSHLYASLQIELSRLRGPCDYSVAFKKKSPLPAHNGVRVAGELDFFDYFSNLYDAYAPGNGSNAGSYAGMCRFRHSRVYAKTNAELCIQALP